MSKFAFYSKSADAAPGKGINESLKTGSVYPGLAKIDNWRRVLSNFFLCQFKYDGKTFSSAEHALILAGFISIIMVVVGLLFGKQMLFILGATPEIIKHSYNFIST